jgi:hypothetical protein
MNILILINSALKTLIFYIIKNYMWNILDRMIIFYDKNVF